MPISTLPGMSAFFPEKVSPVVIKHKLNTYKNTLIDNFKMLICKLISFANTDYEIIPVLKFKTTKENELPKVSFATKERVVNYVLNKIRTDLSTLGFQTPKNLEEDLLKQVTMQKEFRLQDFIGRYTGPAHALKLQILQKKYEDFCKITETKADWVMFYNKFNLINGKKEASIDELWEEITHEIYEKIPTQEEFLDKYSKYEWENLTVPPQYTFDPDIALLIELPSAS